jgi:hypothetical protein
LNHIITIITAIYYCCILLLFLLLLSLSTSSASLVVIDVVLEENDPGATAGPKWWERGPVPCLTDLRPKSGRLFPSLQAMKDAIKFVCVKHTIPYVVTQWNIHNYRYEVRCNKGKDENNKCSFHTKSRAQHSCGGKVAIIKSDLHHSCGILFTRKRLMKCLGTKFVCRQAECFLVDCL